MPGEGAVARGRLWVDAQVPYCQAPNHARDYDADCAMTCTRGYFRVTSLYNKPSIQEEGSSGSQR